jgi:NTF2-related export protein 1/2
MSLMVTVGGSVRLDEKFTGPMREFSETFVLAPDPEKLPALGKKVEFIKGWQKEWVIQTQNFRFTEWGASEIEGAGKKEVGAKEVEMKAANGAAGKRAFGGPSGGRGFASHFAAAGLNIKGKGKA